MAQDTGKVNRHLKHNHVTAFYVLRETRRDHFTKGVGSRTAKYATKNTSSPNLLPPPADFGVASPFLGLCLPSFALDPPLSRRGSLLPGLRGLSLRSLLLGPRGLLPPPPPPRSLLPGPRSLLLGPTLPLGLRGLCPRGLSELTCRSRRPAPDASLLAGLRGLAPGLRGLAPGLAVPLGLAPGLAVPLGLSPLPLRRLVISNVASICISQS